MKSHVRIIGGRWRGRKLPVIDAVGLRPTPDRVRETLFNWLAPKCTGARVLDCFAGSGALGFEAMSRGADDLVIMESHPEALVNLGRQAREMGCDAVTILGGDVGANLPRLTGLFDIVFIDPPYSQPELRKQTLLALEPQLHDEAWIYFEWPRNETFSLPAERWQWRKHKTAGQIEYALAERCPSR